MVDSLCAELIGYRPDDIEYLSFGKKIGVGTYYSQNTKIVELNAQNKSAIDAHGEHAADRYRELIDENSACSACYSSLIYALHRLGGRAKLNGKILIGQGFKGKTGSGFGVGVCTQGFSQCIVGCPPKATDIIEALK